MSSETLPLSQVDDYADSILAQKISQVSGVGLVTINGGQKPAVRVQVDPPRSRAAASASRTCARADRPANVNQPKGNLDGPRQDYTIAANDQLFRRPSFGPLIIAYKNGAPVRLRDVADVIDGVENAQLAGWANGKRAVILNVQRQPGRQRHRGRRPRKGLLPQLARVAPAGHRGEILSDRTETVRASVEDVQFTLVLRSGWSSR